MLDAIQEVHERGFIHRDVKAVLTLLLNPQTIVQLCSLLRLEACFYCRFWSCQKTPR